MLNRSESDSTVGEFDGHNPPVQWNEWGVRTAHALGVSTPYSTVPRTIERLGTVILSQNYLDVYIYASAEVVRRRSGIAPTLDRRSRPASVRRRIDRSPILDR